MPRLIDFQPDDTMPSTSWLKDDGVPSNPHVGMVNLSHFRDADQNSFGAENGGAHRFGAFIHAVGGATNNYILDCGVDWRDRIVLISWIRCSSEDGGSHPIKQAYFPGGPDDTLFCPSTDFGTSDPVDFGATVAYFGSGSDTYIVELTTGIYLYQLSNDYLVLRLTNDTIFDRNSLLLMLSATEQLGKRTSPPSMPSIPLYADGAEVVPLELNALQDGSVMSQFCRSDEYALDEKVLPFGPATHGNPHVAQVWQIQTQDGILEHDGEQYHRPTFERRQKVSGSLRKFFALSAGATSTVTIDSEHDWRDRLITIKGRRSATDIRPGQSGDTSHNAATALDRTGYTGFGSSGTTDYAIWTGNGYIYADNVTGVLKYYNSQGSTQYITGAIMASFQLGARKPQP